MTSLARQAPPWLEQSLRQAAALASVPGLPPAALLCVRRVRAGLDTQGLRHAGGLLGAADKLSRQLQRLAGEARRPARETVPEGTQAVLFDDPAQMLACAARDWLEGVFFSRWWWRSLLDSGALAQGAFALWRLHSTGIPAALVELGQRAGEFCQRLSSAQAETLVKLLIERHALHYPLSIQEEWIPQLPGLAPDDPRQRLLTLGLLLAQAPGLARSSSSPPELAPEAAEQRASTSGIGEAKAESNHPPGLPPIALQDFSGATPLGEVASRDLNPVRRQQAKLDVPDEHVEPALVSSDEPLTRTELKTLARAQSHRAERQTQLPPDTQPRFLSDGSPGKQSPPNFRRADVVGRPPASADAQVVAHASAHPPFAHPDEWLATRYGGVLYLINLALFLDFYPDFTRPADPGLALSPWSFLALVGERLAGTRLRRDPLWQLLASLSGTDVEEPEFCAAPADHLPPLPAALRPYAGKRAPGRSPTSSWTAWLDELMPPLRRRLAAALGVPLRQVGGLLCRQPARIRHTPSRLEAHFSLNEHPLAIRLAGLDRDPGWIPVAAREVRFFYD